MLVGLVVFAQAAIAKPQPGDLDPSFGGDGVVHTHFDGEPGSYWTSVAIGHSDRIVAATSNPSGLFARYKPNGELDPAFSGDGKQAVPFNSAAGASVALGKGGTVIAAGPTCSSRACHLEVARLTAGGELDPGFGQGGKAIFGERLVNDPTPVAIDSRGRTVVAGTTCRKGHCDFGIVRIRQAGDLDPSFGNDGRVTTHVDRGGRKYATQLTAMAIDPRGRIIAAGNATHGRVALVRYTKSGHRDRSFGRHGIVAKKLDRLGGISGIAITPKDKIVAAGRSQRDAGRRWVVARFDRSGALDRSFAKRGQRAIHFDAGGSLAVSAVALDSKNRIVVTGKPDDSLARLRPNGNLDRSFGHHGTVTEDFGRRQFPGALAIDSRDRPVMAGGYPGGRLLARFIG